MERNVRLSGRSYQRIRELVLLRAREKKISKLGKNIWNGKDSTFESFADMRRSHCVVNGMNRKKFVEYSTPLLA
jgi:hypothetical protein